MNRWLAVFITFRFEKCVNQTENWSQCAVNKTPDVNLERSSRSDNMSGGKALCWSEVPAVCQTHPLAGPNVACDTSHPITLPYRWPAAYVCRVHHWIPNQTLSGVITVWAPNPLWSLALSHSPTINLMLQPHSSRSAMHYCKHVLCPKDAFIPGSPAHSPPGWGPEITLLPQTAEPQLQR